MGKIVVTRPVLEEALVLLRKDAEVIANTVDDVLPKSELIRHLQSADGVVSLLTDVIDREVLELCRI